MDARSDVPAARADDGRRRPRAAEGRSPRRVNLARPARRSRATRSGRASRCRPPESTRGFRVSRSTMKSAKLRSGPCSLARMPVLPGCRSASVSSGSSARAGSTKCFDRQPVAFVVVAALLVVGRRPEQHAAPGGLHEMHAQADAVWQRIDEPVDPVAPARRELGVFAAARVDRERHAAERPRHVVGVQAGGVDDRAGLEPLVRRDELDAVAARRGVDQRAADEQGDVARRDTIATSALTKASACTMPVSGDQIAAIAPVTCGSRSRMNARIDDGRGDAVGHARAPAAARARRVRRRCAATTSLPQRRCGTS